jgi:hypothetical protein
MPMAKTLGHKCAPSRQDSPAPTLAFPSNLNQHTYDDLVAALLLRGRAYHNAPLSAEEGTSETALFDLNLSGKFFAALVAPKAFHSGGGQLRRREKKRTAFLVHTSGSGVDRPSMIPASNVGTPGYIHCRAVYCLVLALTSIRIIGLNNGNI